MDVETLGEGGGWDGEWYSFARGWSFAFRETNLWWWGWNVLGMGTECAGDVDGD